MTLEMIEKELRRHPLWEREIPIQMQTGIPYLYLENGALYLDFINLFLYLLRFLGKSRN